MPWKTIFEYLLSGTVVTAIFGGIGYVLTLLIQSRVQHHYDRKIEELKNSISRSNSRVDGIQSATLSLMSARHAALDARRLQAIEALWSATVFERRYSPAVNILQSLNVENIQSIIEAGGQDSEKLKMFGEAMCKLAGLDNPPKKDFVATNERLFVPPLAWSAYEALRSITSQAVVVLLSIKSGVGPKMVKDVSLVNDLVLIALPGMAPYLKDHASSGVYFMTEQLERLIFEQLTIALNFADADEHTVAKTSEIVYRIEAQNVKMPDGIPDQYLQKEFDKPSQKGKPDV